MRPILWISALMLLGTIANAQAAQHADSAARHYRWVDAAGLPHYSDTLSIKALRHGYDVLGADGRVIHHVARVATADANTTAAHDAQRSADQHRNDRQLLMAYPTEADFKAAQQARIKQLDRQLHTTRANLDSQEANLAQLLARAADFSRQGKPVPHALGQRIGKQRKTVDTQRKLLERLQTKRSTAQKKATTRLAHYRKLQARQKARYGR